MDTTTTTLRCGCWICNEGNGISGAIGRAEPNAADRDRILLGSQEAPTEGLLSRRAVSATPTGLPPILGSAPGTDLSRGWDPMPGLRGQDKDRRRTHPAPGHSNLPRRGQSGLASTNLSGNERTPFISSHPLMFLKLTLLGTGTPTPLAHRAGSGYLVEFDEEVLLFDCGPGVARRLLEKAVPAPALTRLFLTHLHYDHCVDYACIVLTRWDQGAGKIPDLDVFGPAPLKRMTERLFGSDGAFGPDLDARTQHLGSEFVYERRGGVLPRERLNPSSPKSRTARAFRVGTGESKPPKSSTFNRSSRASPTGWTPRTGPSSSEATRRRPAA